MRGGRRGSGRRPRIRCSGRASGPWRGAVRSSATARRCQPMSRSAPLQTTRRWDFPEARVADRRAIDSATSRMDRSSMYAMPRASTVARCRADWRAGTQTPWPSAGAADGPARVVPERLDAELRGHPDELVEAQGPVQVEEVGMVGPGALHRPEAVAFVPRLSPSPSRPRPVPPCRRSPAPPSRSCVASWAPQPVHEQHALRQAARPALGQRGGRRHRRPHVGERAAPPRRPRPSRVEVASGFGRWGLVAVPHDRPRAHGRELRPAARRRRCARGGRRPFLPRRRDADLTRGDHAVVGDVEPTCPRLGVRSCRCRRTTPTTALPR